MSRTQLEHGGVRGRMTERILQGGHRPVGNRAATAQPTADPTAQMFWVVNDIVHRIASCEGLVLTPSTKLADIDGWSGHKTVESVLALQRRLDRSFAVDDLDRVATVVDLVALAAERPPNTAAGKRPQAVSAETNVWQVFESLGESCEFGAVQHRLGIMQPHLLRFSAFIGDSDERLARLTAALRDDFKRLAEADLLELRVPNQEWDGAEKEYRCFNAHYGWTIHTGEMVAAHSVESVKHRLADFPASLAFLRDKLLRDLRLGRKIWIWKSAKLSARRDVERLGDELQRHGPNTLLWVHRADADHPPGTVVGLSDRLFQAFISKSDEEWSGDWSDAIAWQALMDVALRVMPALSPASRPSAIQPAASAKPSLDEQNEQDAALALLRDVVAAVVENPDLTLSLDMALADVVGWDSLRHINIVMDIELRLGCEFPPTEIDRMQTIREFVRLIADRNRSR